MHSQETPIFKYEPADRILLQRNRYVVSFSSSRELAK